MTATWPTSTNIAITSDWFGNPAVVLEQETRGFAAPPRSGCAISPDDVWSADILAPPPGRRWAMSHKPFAGNGILTNPSDQGPGDYLSIAGVSAILLFA